MKTDEAQEALEFLDVRRDVPEVTREDINAVMTIVVRIVENLLSIRPTEGNA